MGWVKSLSVAFLLDCISSAGAAETAIAVYPGYLSKIRCEGRLLVSAVGNDTLIRLEALPKELGCGVLLKPRATSGRTNLFLETSTGTVSRVLEITQERKPSRFEVQLKPEMRE